MIDVAKVSNKKQLRSFIDFPRELYRNEPRYIQDLNTTIKSRLTPKNPFLHHSEIALFLAQDLKRGKILGRIAAIFNLRHLKYHNDQTGFFGFFDSINDQKVSGQLFIQAERWLKSRDVRRMVGPTNLTTNDSCGILTHGFDYPNQVNMPYNYPYYRELVKANGFHELMELFSYQIIDRPKLDRYGTLLKLVQQRLTQSGIIIRSLNSRSYYKDILRLRKAYNLFNAKNWGFLPLDRVEFTQMAKELKMIMPYQLALIAEKEDQIIGFVVAAPDFNQVLKRIPSGKLFPSGILKILKHKKHVDNARVMILGLHPSFRGSGLDLLLYNAITRALHKQNIFRCEAAYVMKSNKSMISMLVKMGGEPIKRYGLFQKEI